jgi:ribosome-binding protein aMBF1 (putative translation factor)
MEHRKQFPRLHSRKPGKPSRHTDRNTSSNKRTRAVAGKRSPLLGRAPYTPSPEQRRFGQRVAELRKSIGMELMELARRCGIALLRMERIEAGEVCVGLPTIFHIAETLGFKSYQLFIGIDGEETTGRQTPVTRGREE